MGRGGRTGCRSRWRGLGRGGGGGCSFGGLCGGEGGLVWCGAVGGGGSVLSGQVEEERGRDLPAGEAMVRSGWWLLGSF